ncbi:MAG TPA: FMN-binding negative transcriptional regulator [Usitatibacter sp.]|nr:FMN-binding negative transcriptional regulator [Usitatibacter sp.]
MTLYVPPQFRMDDLQAQLALMRDNAFGTLVSGTAGGEPHVSHVPFVIECGGAGRVTLQGHVARANAHWEALQDGARVTAIFQGPHAYVSPGWYASHPAVPTWNYAVVHAHGTARLMDEAELHALLMTLSNAYEAGRPRPWRMSELPADYVAMMLRSIVGFEIAVERLDGKFKLSQNRAAEIPRVIAALEAEGEGALARLMREHSPAAG